MSGIKFEEVASILRYTIPGVIELAAVNFLRILAMTHIPQSQSKAREDTSFPLVSDRVNMDFSLSLDEITPKSTTIGSRDVNNTEHTNTEIHVHGCKSPSRNKQWQTVLGLTKGLMWHVFSIKRTEGTYIIYPHHTHGPLKSRYLLPYIAGLERRFTGKSSKTIKKKVDKCNSISSFKLHFKQ